MSFQGVGSVVGGLIAAPLLKRFGDLRLAGIGVFVFGAADGFLLVPHLGAIAGAAAFAGLGLVWAIVAIATAYQRRSPATCRAGCPVLRTCCSACLRRSRSHSEQRSSP
jgi:hypothetical protein